MQGTKAVGLGLGALGASALASCPIVQAMVLALLGGLGALPFFQRHPVGVALLLIGCGAVVVFGVLRLRRVRRPIAYSSPRRSASINSSSSLNSFSSQP